jgi:hypothetical protein
MMKKQFFLVTLLLSVSITFGELAAYWPLNESSGTTATDASGNGITGFFYSANGSNYPQWIAGHDGTGHALRFNGSTTASSNSNRLVTDPNAIAMDPNVPGLGNLTEAFTIAMWVRRDAVDYFNNLFPRLVHTSAYDVQLALDPSAVSTSPDAYDYLGWTGVSGNRLAIGIETDAQKTLGSWYHMAVTCDGGVIKKYINGGLIASISIPGIDMPTTAGSFVIGSKLDNTSYFTGALDDVAVWAGSYLPAEEVAKLANNTATPLTVSDITPEPPLPPNYFKKETDLAWTSSGWKLLYGPGFSTFLYWPNENITVNSNNTATAWWIKDTEQAGWPSATMVPGGHYALWAETLEPFIRFRNVTPENYYTAPDRNVETFGMSWVDPSWSGREPNVAVFAPYITPGIALCIPNTNGYEPYQPQVYSWQCKDYFKTYARVAAVSGAGASLNVKSYSYINGTNPLDPANLTELGEVSLPLNQADYVWQDLKFAYPKPTSGTPRVWTEISIIGGNADTKVYIDEFNPISDQANTSQHTATYKPGDFDKDTIVKTEDFWQMADGWLTSSSGMLEPRSGGMLYNGDFYEDFDNIASADDAHQAIDPTGWSFTRQSPGTGDYGIWRAAKRGQFNYSTGTYGPLGASIVAYTTDVTENDPYGVLEQTASQTADAGQTYYAMVYVLGTHPTDSWRSWKDTATMTIAVNGADVATFTRKLSRNIWRPLYGTYTATSADAGKPITIRLSYANTHTAETTAPGYMFVGYAYLGTTIPVEWPEERPNLLTNGAFEDLSALEAVAPSVAQSIRNGDNWGAWFVDGSPAPTGWVYEVPAGYSLANKGGIWASGIYATPLPSPGLSDVDIYTSNTLVLGQVIGSLAAGTTYYLDMACGVNTSLYRTNTNWPNPAPVFHIELWRIPAGVTDGTTIYNAIASSNPNYIKVAEAAVSSTGNIDGAQANFGTPASKWQLIGATYTSQAADSTMYVRIRGPGGAASNPEFAFCDVYLSTEKRLVPGGSYSFNISAGMPYDVFGPYNCFHGTLMGVGAPETDLDGNCLVNLKDLAMMAENWLENWYANITGIAPWN